MEPGMTGTLDPREHPQFGNTAETLLRTYEETFGEKRPRGECGGHCGCSGCGPGSSKVTRSAEDKRIADLWLINVSQKILEEEVPQCPAATLAVAEIGAAMAVGPEDYWNFVHCLGHNLVSRISVPASILIGAGWEYFELEAGIVKKTKGGYCEVWTDLLVMNLGGQLACNEPIAQVVQKCYCYSMGNPMALNVFGKIIPDPKMLGLAQWLAKSWGLL